MKIQKKVHDLRDTILEAIAERMPFSFDEIRLAYDVCRSYDMVIAACKLAAVLGCDTLSKPLGYLMQGRERGQDALELGIISWP